MAGGAKGSTHSAKFVYFVSTQPRKWPNLKSGSAELPPHLPWKVQSTWTATGSESNYLELEPYRGKMPSIARDGRAIPSKTRSPRGKLIEQLLAVRPNLIGRKVLLPADDAEEYTELLESLRSEFKPRPGREAELVQTMVDARWRLRRIRVLESAVFAAGRHKYAHLFPDVDAEQLGQLLDGMTFQRESKQLMNLTRQEERLQRYFHNALRELMKVQESMRRYGTPYGYDL